MMQPENEENISNLLNKAPRESPFEEEEENNSESVEETIDFRKSEESDTFDYYNTTKQKNQEKKSKRKKIIRIILALLFAGFIVRWGFILFKRYKINGNSESDVTFPYSFTFEPNKIINGEYNETLAVKCQNGIFVGSLNENVISFKGIPYAKPPTGNLRWKPPIKPDDDEKVYETYNFGYSPIQSRWKAEPASYYEQSEDCLTLNIWTGYSKNSEVSNSTSKKPVIVFIHGGSFGWGGTVDPLYDGFNLVNSHPEIVFVTINYRLGIMGFIDFSRLRGGENYKESGNLGILDQIQALEWIKENISGFGGDPENVTILGETTGAASASILAVIPKAKDLFKRMIAQSGSVTFTYSRKECQKLTKMLLKEAKVHRLKDLLSMSEDALKKINNKLNDYANLPERDGIVLPLNLYQVYRNGTSKNIDILIGTNEDESRYWVRAFGNEYLYQMTIPVLYENNMKRVSREDRKSAEKFIHSQNAYYPKSVSKFYNELLFHVPAVEQAIDHSMNGGNVYMYYWTYPSSNRNSTELFNDHSVELSYIMGDPDETWNNKDLVSKVQNMWINFATNGNPSIVNGTAWENFSPNNKKMMVIGEKVELKDNIINEEEYKLIKPLLKYNFNGSYSSLSYNINYVKIVTIGIICILIVLILVCIFIRKSYLRIKYKQLN